MLPMSVSGVQWQGYNISAARDRASDPCKVGLTSKNTRERLGSLKRAGM